MAEDPATGRPPSPPAPFRRSVLVVEDEPLLRDALGRSLEAHGFAVATAASAPDARRAFGLLDPDGVLMDVDLGPGPDGFALADALVALGTGAAIVFLTDLPDPRFAGRTEKELPPGVAYLRKSNVRDLDLLARTLDAAMRGTVEAGMRHDRDPGRPLSSLTRSQLDVLRLVASGYTNARIAMRRGTTTRAVEKALERICETLGIPGGSEGNARVEAARRFLEAGGRPVPDGPEQSPA